MTANPSATRTGFYRRYGKRLCDVVCSGIGLICLSPLLLTVWLAVKFSSRGGAFFRQERVGRDGKSFKILKFRSMVEKRDDQGQLLPDEARITKLGAFLRRTSLDELPQFWNVLRGDMSVVGPRPLLMRYLDRYTPEQARRHLVPPGITGWTQVSGRNDLPWEQKFALDVWYVDHWSLWLDFKILCLTLWKVIKREGISAAGSASMPEFMGSSAASGTNELALTDRGDLS